MAQMTPEVIVASCKANGGYAAPRLNDQLFLHCRGFPKIENLEPYTSTKVLWLEQNSIRSFHGLEGQRELVSLFLQNNTICSLRSLTFQLPNLRVLNLSHNYLSSLRGLGAACPLLETLQVSHNRIASLAACEDLWALADTLTSVDLSFNRIEGYGSAPATDEEAVELEGAEVTMEDSAPVPAVADDVRVIELPDGADAEAGLAELQRQGEQLGAPGAAPEDPLVLVNFFKRLPGVSVIYIQGNSISRGLKHYRRNMILHLPQLTYLDERPVFDDERRVVEAWGSGGAEAESAARAAIRQEKREHLNSCVRVLTDKMEGSREVRERLTRQWETQRARELEERAALRRTQREEREACERREAALRETIENEAQSGHWDLEDAFTAALAPLRAAEAQHRHAYEQALAVEAATAAAAAEIAAEERAMETAVGAVDAAVVGSEAAPADPVGRSTVLAELMRTDDDILREMEDEIDSVLNSLEPSFYESQQRRASQSLGSGGLAEPAASTGAAAAGSPATGGAAAAAAAWQPYSRTTAKVGRAVHAAVGVVASKLRECSPAAPAAATAQDLWSRFDEWERRQRAQ